MKKVEKILISEYNLTGLDILKVGYYDSDIDSTMEFIK